MTRSVFSALKMEEKENEKRDSKLQRETLSFAKRASCPACQNGTIIEYAVEGNGESNRRQ